MTAEDEARQANETIVVNGSEEDFRRFVYTKLCSLKEGQDDIAANGCAKACQPGVMEKWTPHAVVTAIIAGLYALVETWKK